MTDLLRFTSSRERLSARACLSRMGASLLRPVRAGALAAALASTLLICACGIGDGDNDGGTPGTQCEGQVTSCAQLAGGSCDGQDGCFSGGQIGTCNGSATECADLTDDDECLAQEGCRLADD